MFVGEASPAVVYYTILQFIALCTHLDAAVAYAFAWFYADVDLAGQAKKKVKTAKGRKEYIPNKGDANWTVVLMLLKVAKPAAHCLLLQSQCLCLMHDHLSMLILAKRGPFTSAMLLLASCVPKVVLCTGPQLSPQHT